MAYEFFIALRYAFVRRKNRFISFISLVSIIGMALGVAALIVVLSVMNGFQRELRLRMLGVVSHVQITGFNNTVRHWDGLLEKIKSLPVGKDVVASAPYILAQGMLTHSELVQGALIRGIIPADELKVSEFAEYMRQGSLTELEAGKYRIVLGTELAKSLGVSVGDSIAVIAPQGNVTLAGILPRIRQFKVIGLFSANMFEYDSSLALIHLDDAQTLFRLDGLVSGVRLKLSDLMTAPQVTRALNEQLRGLYYVSDWTTMNRNFFRAVQIEKNAMFVILTLIVAVAAFNIVSSLVMTVTDKRADIAVLQTLGAQSSGIRHIFMILGTLTGLIGIVIGLIAGIAIALNIDVIVPAIESLFGVHFLDQSVYAIGELPSELRWQDVTLIGVVAFLLSVLSTIVPSWQAARTRPAEALRYE